MKETSYYELKMPDSNDTIDVSVLNNNMKRLDDVLILTVIGRTAETSEFVKKCCAPYIMIQNLGEETVTIYDRRWPEDMWEDNKIVIEPTKFYIYRVANSVNANFLVLDNKECNFRYFITAEQAIAEGGGGGGGGTTDYNELDNQPKVNGIVLVGNKSFKELGLLNDDGKIKSDYLPPFVDNMDSYDTEADFPRPGVEDRLYLDKSTNLAYIWTGTDYACIGTPLALGITHETAGYGDESRAAYNHSLSEHARVDATKTEASSVNGKIKINGTDVDVYTHPQAEGQEATNPHGTTASDVGLGNLLNAKQVTVTEQAYSDTEKVQARKNIGAGTSSFSGKYSDLTEIPSEFTPAEHNHDDLYAHKTSVSSVDNTTRIVTVPEDVAGDFAAVKMIGGKTVKRNINDDIFVVGGISSSDGTDTTETDRMRSVNKISVNTNCTYTLDTDLTLVWMYEYSSTGFIQRVGISKPNTEYKPSANTKSIKILIEITSYTPNEVKLIENQLTSAPVTAVESTGVNIIDEQFELGDIAYASGDNLDSTARIRTKNYIPVNGGSTIYVIRPNNTCGNIFAYDKDKQYLGRYTGGLYEYNSYTNSITLLPNAAFIKMELGAIYGTKYKNDICLSYNEVPSYVPHIDKTTISLDEIINNLPDYGISVNDNLYNYVDQEEMIYHHKVGTLDLGTLDWTYNSTYSKFNSSVVPNIKNLPNIDTMPNMIAGKYTTITPSDTNSQTITNGISQAATDKNLIIRDTPMGTDAKALKASLNGQTLNYELDKEELIPLTDLLLPFKVEAGGTITFENEHNLDVPNSVIYEKEVLV